MTRLKRRWHATTVGQAVTRYGEVKGQRWAVVIGWNALLSFFPIVLAVLGLLSLILQGSGVDTTVRAHVIGSFPSADDRATVGAAIDGVKQHSGLLGGVGLVALLWSGSALFGAIDEALDALYPVPPRNFVKQKLMAGQMVLLFTIFTVPLIASSSLIPALSSIPDVPGFLVSGPAAWLIQVAAGFLVGSVLFCIIYVVVPNRRVRLRRALGGALVAGGLLEVLVLVFPVYFAISHGFAKYGQTFGLFFVLMNFFLLFGMITMIGGAVNVVRDSGAARLPDENRRPGLGLAQPEQPAARPGEAGGVTGHGSPEPSAPSSRRPLGGRAGAAGGSRRAVARAGHADAHERAAEAVLANRGLLIIAASALVGLLARGSGRR